MDDKRYERAMKELAIGWVGIALTLLYLIIT